MGISIYNSAKCTIIQKEDEIIRVYKNDDSVQIVKKLSDNKKTFMVVPYDMVGDVGSALINASKNNVNFSTRHS